MQFYLKALWKPVIPAGEQTANSTYLRQLGVISGPEQYVPIISGAILVQAMTFCNIQFVIGISFLFVLAWNCLSFIFWLLTDV